MAGKTNKLNKHSRAEVEAFNDRSERLRYRNQQTSAQNKLNAYFAHLATSERFIKDIVNFRKKYSIPEEGYKKDVFEKSSFSDDLLLVYPNIAVIGDHEDYSDDLDKLCKKYKLGIMAIDWIECFIFYSHYRVNSYLTLIETVDCGYHFYGPFSCKEEGESGPDHVKFLSKEYPVAIFLNPYISQRDLIDYIKKTYRLGIEPELKRYREKGVDLGKVRKKNDRVTNRDYFIYQHRDRSAKEIVSLVAQHFGETLDYTYISRIIKQQQKIRK